MLFIVLLFIAEMNLNLIRAQRAMVRKMLNQKHHEKKSKNPVNGYGQDTDDDNTIGSQGRIECFYFICFYFLFITFGGKPYYAL